MSAVDFVQPYLMLTMNPRTHLFCTLALSVLLLSCSGASAPAGGIEPRTMADAMHAVMRADRTVYARHVVDRLQNKEQVILASEHWADDKALPLPAQMFRMGAELASEGQDLFSYALLSKWPVNKKSPGPMPRRPVSTSSRRTRKRTTTRRRSSVAASGSRPSTLTALWLRPV